MHYEHLCGAEVEAVWDEETQFTRTYGEVLHIQTVQLLKRRRTFIQPRPENICPIRRARITRTGMKMIWVQAAVRKTVGD
jgi:hypothetical protein